MTPTGSKRTNSLGRAASDCFACQKLAGVTQSRCDRQRPRCNVCTDAGKICSGYLQEFQWQGGAQRALWRTKSHVEQATRAPAGDASSATSQLPKDPEGVTHPTSQRPTRSADKQQFQFIQENVEADYVDKSFSNNSKSTLYETNRSKIERQLPPERRRIPLPPIEHSLHSPTTTQTNLAAEPFRSMPFLPPVRGFEQGPRHRSPFEVERSASWASTRPMAPEMARLSIPGFTASAALGPRTPPMQREVSRPRAERPPMLRAATGPYPTRELIQPRFRSNSIAQGAADNMSSINDARGQSGASSSRGRQSWHEVVGSRTRSNDNQRASFSSHGAPPRGRAPSQSREPE